MIQVQQMNGAVLQTGDAGGGIHFSLALILAAIRPNETRDWAAQHIVRRRQSKAIDLAGTPRRSRIICDAFPLSRFPIFPFPFSRCKWWGINRTDRTCPLGVEQNKTERNGDSARDKARFGTSKRDADAGHLQQSARFTAWLLTPSMGGDMVWVACGSGWMVGGMAMRLHEKHWKASQLSNQFLPGGSAAQSGEPSRKLLQFILPIQRRWFKGGLTNNNPAIPAAIFKISIPMLLVILSKGVNTIWEGQYLT